MSIALHKNRRLILVLTLLGAISGVTILPYLLGNLPGGLNGAVEQSRLPSGVVVSLIVLQTTVLTGLTSWIGLSLAVKVGLDLPIWRRWLNEGRFVSFSNKWLAISLIGSFVGTLLVSTLEIFAFSPLLPEIAAVPALPLWTRALTMFYGGIVEEVLLRLFLMTLLVWVMSRFLRNRTPIPPYVYISAIFMAAILFGLGHLPATLMIFGELTPLLIVRALVGNGLLGIFFGFLYWKKGFEYAVIAHMAGDLFLHVIWFSLLT